MNTHKKQPVNVVQYLAELNQRLWADPEFSEGMEFKLYRDGKIAGHLRDADAMGACTIPAVFGRIEQHVAQEFELVTPMPVLPLPQGALH